MTKRTLLGIFLAAILSVSLAGCGGSSQPEPAPEPAPAQEERSEPKFGPAPEAEPEPEAEAEPEPEPEAAPAPETDRVSLGTTVTVDELSITVPSEWGMEGSDDEGHFFYPDYNGLLYINRTDLDSSGYESQEDYRETYSRIIAGIENDGTFVVDDDPEEFMIGPARAFRATGEATIDSDKLSGWVELVISSNKLYLVMFLVGVDERPVHADEILAVLDTITVGDNAAALGNAEGSPAPASGTPTTSQKNALDRALSYLSFMPFSREGLIDQLEYEGFSHEDAEYAADHCGADWNEQAVEKALSYLDFMSFSYSGLVGQLEFEGFTHDQAVYGVDHCGADWYEQAEKKAQEYLEFMSFSHSGLVDQLEYEGFTHDQAEHGVTAAGL